MGPCDRIDRAPTAALPVTEYERPDAPATSGLMMTRPRLLTRLNAQARSGLRTARPPLLSIDVVSAIVRRPSLWPEALRTVHRMRPTRPGPGRRSLLPSAEYLSFRLHTNTGTDEPPTGDDVVRFLKWTGSQRRVLR
jgi:hypothetical protein